MSRTTLEGALTRDERAKLLALGGVAWIRLQLRATPMPDNPASRTIGQLSTAERQQIIDKVAPSKVLARRFNVASIKSIDVFRSRMKSYARK